MLKLLIDENFDQRILRGVQLRIPGLGYTVVQETSLAGAGDGALLEWAAAEPHVLVTHDRNTMLKAAYDRIRAGKKTAGLVIVKKELPLTRVIEDLVLLVECCTEADFEGQILFVPL